MSDPPPTPSARTDAHTRPAGDTPRQRDADTGDSDAAYACSATLKRLIARGWRHTSSGWLLGHGDGAQLRTSTGRGTVSLVLIPPLSGPTVAHWNPIAASPRWARAAGTEPDRVTVGQAYETCPCCSCPLPAAPRDSPQHCPMCSEVVVTRRLDGDARGLQALIWTFPGALASDALAAAEALGCTFGALCPEGAATASDA